MTSKIFTINSSIIKDRHYHINFDFQIEETWAVINQEKNLSIIMPATSGKTTLLQNLHTFITRNTRDTAFLMDFSHFNRNSMSTFDKFLSELKDLFMSNARQISSAMVKLIESSPLTSKNELIYLLERIDAIIENRSILLIDNADKHVKHDSFSEFLGLLLKKQEDMKSKSGSSFNSIVISGEKSINNFKPFERGLDDADFFTTWLSKEIFTKTVPVDETSIRSYLAEYTAEIGFDLEPNSVKEILEKSSANLLTINKILKFLDEKVIKFKKQKIITSAEIHHAAGYVLANVGPRK